MTTETLIILLQRVSLWLALTAVASMIAAALYPLFAGALRRCAPSARSAMRLAYALTPPLVAATTVTLLLWPEAAAWLVPEHCHAGHCGSHAPAGAPTAPGSLLFATAGGIAALALALFALAGLRVTRRRLALLSRLAGRPEPPGWRMLETEQPVAWCSGLLRPEVLISRGLAERLEASELEVVIAHERAHADRLDNLLLCLAGVATAAWHRPRRRRLLRDLSRDCEQACDRLAAERCGRRKVAAVIRRVAALAPVGEGAPGRAVAFRAIEPPDRLAALAAPRNDGSAFAAAALLCVHCVLLVAFLGAPAHAFLEWLGMAA